MNDQTPVKCSRALHDEARAEFDRLVEEHWDDRIHQPQDAVLFEMAAIYWVEFREMGDQIKRDGYMVPATRRGAMKPHPLIGHQNAVSREYRRVLDMLGCTAASRKRLGLKKPLPPIAGLPGCGERAEIRAVRADR